MSALQGIKSQRSTYPLVSKVSDTRIFFIKWYYIDFVRYVEVSLEIKELIVLPSPLSILLVVYLECPSSKYLKLSSSYVFSLFMWQKRKCKTVECAFCKHDEIKLFCVWPCHCVWHVSDVFHVCVLILLSYHITLTFFSCCIMTWHDLSWKYLPLYWYSAKGILRWF